MAGGQSVGSGGGVGGPVLGALEEYDLASRTWVRRAEMATPRSHLALACVLNTTLVAVRTHHPLPPLATAPCHRPLAACPQLPPSPS